MVELGHRTPEYVDCAKAIWNTINADLYKFVSGNIRRNSVRQNTVLIFIA